MANQETVPSQTQKEFNEATAGLELDLTAFFSMARDDILALTDKAIKEGWTPEQLIDEIDRLFGDPVISNEGALNG